jgi:hypothetical protein
MSLASAPLVTPDKQEYTVPKRDVTCLRQIGFQNFEKRFIKYTCAKFSILSAVVHFFS